eukprot:RCo054293
MEGGAAQNNAEGEDVVTAVPYSFARDYLEKKWRLTNIYRDMAVYVCFLVMLMFYFTVGREIPSNYFFETGFPGLLVKQKIPGLIVPKTYYDIGSNGEWYPWWQSVALPTSWQLSPQDPTKPLNRYALGGGILLGAARLRVIKVRNDSCTVNSDVYPPPDVMSRECFASLSRKAEDTTTFTGPSGLTYRWVDPAVSPGTVTTGEVTTYHSGGFTVLFDFQDSWENISAKADAIVQDDFVSMLTTRFVTWELFAYSPPLDSFVSVKLFVEIPAAGCWRPWQQIRLFRARTSVLTGQTVYDFFFLAFVVYYVQRWIWGWVQRFRLRPFKLSVVVGYPFELWSFLDLLNLSIFVVVFALQWTWWGKSNGLTMQLPFPGRYPGELEDILYLYSAQCYLNSVNLIFSFLKLLYFLRVNDVLSVLGRTMANCQKNLLGVLVLFLFVVLGFSMTATTLFAAGIDDFRDVGYAFGNLMRMLMGDFDYLGMRDENRYLAGLFFWAFEILALFVLLNFMVACIADGFDRAMENQPPNLLWRQIENFYANLKKATRDDVISRVKLELYTPHKFYLKQLEHSLGVHFANVLVGRDPQKPVLCVQKSDLQEAVNNTCSGGPDSAWYDDVWKDLVLHYTTDLKHLEDEDRAQCIQNGEDGVELAMADACKAVEELHLSVVTLHKRLTHTLNLTAVASKAPPLESAGPSLVGGSSRNLAVATPSSPSGSPSVPRLVIPFPA